MKKKIIAIVIIILICIGTALYMHHKQSARSQSASTAIIHYVATVDQGSEPNEKGTCWTGSIAAPFRTDAWRCTTGNQIADPCFEIAGTNKLLCSPTGNDDDNFILTLTQSVPKAIPASEPAPANWAWKMQLADGTICTPFTGTGTLTADHQEGYYGCSDGTTLLGSINNAAPLWTVSKATLSSAANDLPAVLSQKTVPVKTIWQ